MARTRTMTIFREDNSVGDWSPDRWIVQHNITRLKRWIETDPDENRQRKLAKIIEAEERKLSLLSADKRQTCPIQSDQLAFWGS